MHTLKAISLLVFFIPLFCGCKENIYIDIFDKKLPIPDGYEVKVRGGNDGRLFSLLKVDYDIYGDRESVFFYDISACGGDCPTLVAKFPHAKILEKHGFGSVSVVEAIHDVDEVTYNSFTLFDDKSVIYVFGDDDIYQRWIKVIKE